MQGCKELLGSTILGRGKQTFMKFIIDSNKFIRLPGGKCVGFSEVICEDCLVGSSSKNEAGIQQMNIESDSKRTLPEHLVDLYKRSAKDINEVEQKHLKIMMIEFKMFLLRMIWT